MLHSNFPRDDTVSFLPENRASPPCNPPCKMLRWKCNLRIRPDSLEMTFKWNTLRQEMGDGISRFKEQKCYRPEHAKEREGRVQLKDQFHSTRFWSFSACSVLFVPTNDLMFMYSCGTVYFHGYGYPCLFSKMILLNRASYCLNSSGSHWSPHRYGIPLVDLNLAFLLSCWWLFLNKYRIPFRVQALFHVCCDSPQSCSCSFSAVELISSSASIDWESLISPVNPDAHRFPWLI